MVITVGPCEAHDRWQLDQLMSDVPVSNQNQHEGRINQFWHLLVVSGVGNLLVTEA